MAQQFATWSPSVWYEPNAFVQYAGLTWQCLAQNQNREPNTNPTYWSVFQNGGGGGGGVQQLGLTGNTISLSGGGGSVNVANATAVSSTTQKTTEQSYSTGVTDFLNGVTALDFDARNNVIARNDLLIGSLPSQVNVGNTLSGLSSQVGTNTNDILTLQGQVSTNTSNISTLQTRVAFRDTTDFYVSNNGSNSTGDGSFLNPYQTIQYAVTQAEAVASVSNICFVYVASGHYDENVNFTKGYVIVSGATSSPQEGETTELTGTITINITTGADDLFNRQVAFQNIQITGTITDNSTVKHSLIFQNAKIYGASSDIRMLYQNSTVDCRTYILDTIITSQNATQNLTPMIQLSRGTSYIIRCSFTTGGTGGVLQVDGAGIMGSCGLTTFESSYVAALSPANSQFPIVRLAGTSTSVNSFGSCAFLMSGVANRSGETNATGIAFDSTTNKVANVIQCVFSLYGTTAVGNANHVVKNYTNPTIGNHTIGQGSNIAAPTISTNKIDATRITINTWNVVS